ncbi:hypothetical protein HWV62_9819, partial [Athelia sp. TMB]
SMITTRTKLRCSYDESLKELSTLGSVGLETVHHAEFQHAAVTLALAITNCFSANFDIERLADRVKNTRVKDGDNDDDSLDPLGKFFTPTGLGVIDMPATVLDQHGRIILWYLPDIVAPFRIAAFNLSIRGLKQPLRSSMQESNANRKGTTWRHANYHAPADGGLFGAGTLNLSPGWFQQGHERLVDGLHISQDMQKKGVHSFLNQNYGFELFINSVTSVMNPQLYSSGLQAIQTIQGDCPHIPWHSVWSAMALIVNRETPYHRDTGGSISMHDVLVSAGTHQDCYIEVAELGAEFSYLPATMLGLAGKALKHRVKSWAGGERICSAHFMRDEVHNRFGLPRPAWPLWDNYL